MKRPVFYMASPWVLARMVLYKKVDCLAHKKRDEDDDGNRYSQKQQKQ